MRNELLKPKDIANRLALEIEKRLSALPTGSAGSQVRGTYAEIDHKLLPYSDRHLCGTMDQLMFMLAPKIDEAAEMLVALSGGIDPCFLSPPELPGGLEHCDIGYSGTVSLRYLRGYSIADNLKWCSIGFRIIAMKWSTAMPANA